MALVVETGAIVAGANSYVTLAEARSYSLARGLTLSADDAVLTALLISANDYIEAQRARFQGVKVSALQDLQFPRSGVVVDDIEVAADSIPVVLKYAQIRLAMEASKGVDLMPTKAGPFVIEDTVGPITTKYSEKIGVTAEPELTAVSALLDPLFKRGNVGTFLTTVRV